MPRSRVSQSLINHDQGAGVKKNGLVAKIGYNGILSSMLSRRTKPINSITNNNNIIYKNAIGIFSGMYTSMAVMSDNYLYAWGYNSKGLYGNGTSIDRNTPIKTGILNIVKLDSHTNLVLSLTSNNKLYSWGDNSYGQLGDGTNIDSTIPVEVDMTGVLSGKTITQIGCNDIVCLVLSSDNKLFSWGGNGAGMLGDGTNNDSNIPVSVDMTGVLFGKTITNIGVGAIHCIVTTSDNKICAWGNNVYGQYGDGTYSNSSVPVETNNSGLLLGKTIVKISAGYQHNLVLTSDNKLYTWGYNLSGQLGNGTNNDSNVPVEVDMTGVLSGKTITQISTKGHFCLVLTSDNNLYSWGDNTYGQLGDGTNISSNIPVEVNIKGVLSKKTISQISCYFAHFLILTTDGDIYACGMNIHGELGNNTNNNKNVPFLVKKV